MKAEILFEEITIVEFRAYDKSCEEHFIDKTPEQITGFIFKNLCNTAVIQKMTMYKIESAHPLEGFKRKMD